MKIGILGCFYDCADTLGDVLAPWRAFKQEAPAAGHNIVFAAINCQFSEYAEAGFPDDDDATRNILARNRDLFDDYQRMPHPLNERDVRRIPLQYVLAQDVDVVWILDGDEIYTLEQIYRSVDFVLQNPSPDFYGIHFKNYIFDGARWCDGGSSARIYRTDRHGGLDHFYFDNDIAYKDGSLLPQASYVNLPRDVAWVAHRTWSHRQGKKKIFYQRKHRGECSYQWNEEKGELEFDPDYFRKRGQTVPQLFTDDRAGIEAWRKSTGPETMPLPDWASAYGAGAEHSGLKLNLGCGFDKKQGYVNVDSAPACKPDVLFDLETFPWPWEDNSADEIHLEHVLEHLGQTPSVYLQIWRELWRVCKPNALITIIVPHWRHDNFVHDPTHVRAITPTGVMMFNQMRNVDMLGQKETKLGLLIGVDIEFDEVRDTRYGFCADVAGDPSLSQPQIMHLLSHQNNIANEIRMTARAVKPPRGEQWLNEQSR